MSYDSTEDTTKHILRVQELLNNICDELISRGKNHDITKLNPPEKEIFDEMTPKLKSSTYGSEEYNGFLAHMKVALNHHYSNNKHHPEHYENGVNGMSLVDLIEMFCDWKAATERHSDGNIGKSIEINTKRFNLSQQLVDVLSNTAKKFGWIA